MMTTIGQKQFSDAAIRQFLLGQMRGSERVAFERVLCCDASLEQRTRLEEIAVADDYATRRLHGKDRDAFTETFACSSARRNQIEVSIALRERFAPAASAGRGEAWLPPKHPVWKLAFATMILIMLFATIWVATKEPRFVRRFVPHRNRPAAATTPTPEVTHHAERVAEPAHNDRQTPVPGHELAGLVVVLDSTTKAENAPIVTLSTILDENLRVQLVVGEVAQSTYLAELIKSTGEIVYSEREIAATDDSTRVNFDIPIEYLAAADFQIKLTRTSDGKQMMYFLRVR